MRFHFFPIQLLKSQVSKSKQHILGEKAAFNHWVLWVDVEFFQVVEHRQVIHLRHQITNQSIFVRCRLQFELTCFSFEKWLSINETDVRFENLPSLTK
jgi:hypothetical protein